MSDFNKNVSIEQGLQEETHILFGTIIDSGTCGENLTWVLNSEGVLTISGWGEMSYSGLLGPWYSKMSEIKEVIIEDGVTSIGAGAFFSCENLITVNMSSTITKIWRQAFYNCSSLTSVTIGSGVTSIGENAFGNCTSLSCVLLSKALERIEKNSFAYCKNLRSILIPNNVNKIAQGAFANNENLTDVIVYTKNCEMNLDSFKSTTSNVSSENLTIYAFPEANFVLDEELGPYIKLLKNNTNSTNNNLFIAGVGQVDLFKDDNVVLTSRTLIDSAISVSVSLEDIKSSGGAKLYGKYSTDSALSLKLTDAMFRMDFLAANLGADVELGGSFVGNETSVVIDGQIVIEGEPQKLYEGADKVIVWITKKNDLNSFINIQGTDIEKGVGEFIGKTIIKNLPFEDNSEVCVRYIKEHEIGQTLKISANFLPDEMTAVLTASLFAGDQNNLENSTKVGTLTITIPRFMPNGIVDLSMTMNGHCQTILEGEALVVEEDNCEENGYYAIISKVVNSGSWNSNLIRIMLSEAGDLEVGEQLEVYGIFAGIGTRQIPLEKVNIIPREIVDEYGILQDTSIDIPITVILKDDGTKMAYGVLKSNI